MSKRLFNRIFGILILAVATALLPAHAESSARSGKDGFVIQVSDNDPAKWNLALNNANNVRQELPNAEIEIVAYGPGLNMLKFDSAVAGRLNDAQASGIGIIACGNTMKGMKLTKDDLHPAAQVVKAGLLEIHDKQQKGWTYVRP